MAASGTVFQEVVAWLAAPKCHVSRGLVPKPLGLPNLPAEPPVSIIDRLARESTKGPMAGHITHDPIYDTVAPDNFPAMLDVERYGQRTSAFDAIISGTAPLDLPALAGLVLIRRGR